MQLVIYHTKQNVLHLVSMNKFKIEVRKFVQGVRNCIKIGYTTHIRSTGLIQSVSGNDFLMSLDFSILSNQSELENLTNTIGEMLGTFQKVNTPQPDIKSK